MVPNTESDNPHFSMVYKEIVIQWRTQAYPIRRYRDGKFGCFIRLSGQRTEANEFLILLNSLQHINDGTPMQGSKCRSCAQRHSGPSRVSTFFWILNSFFFFTNQLRITCNLQNYVSWRSIPNGLRSFKFFIFIFRFLEIFHNSYIFIFLKVGPNAF